MCWTIFDRCSIALSFPQENTTELKRKSFRRAMYSRDTLSLATEDEDEGKTSPSAIMLCSCYYH